MRTQQVQPQPAVARSGPPAGDRSGSPQHSTGPGASVDDALAWASERAGDEKGRSGEEHLRHARESIGILRSLGADDASQIAMALFAPAERLPLREIESRFGAEVTRLVDAMRQVQRLRELHTQASASASQVETLRRMLLAMSTDIRVVVLRLASRLRTLRYHAETRSAPDPAIARETLEVLAPLANRLGLWQLKWELEDFAFRFLEPDEYRTLARKLEERRVEREASVKRAQRQLGTALADAGLKAQLSGRPKHIYSIYAKMRRKNQPLEEISDLRALRVIVDTVAQCYSALAVVHALWKQVPAEYDDYIVRPKPNGYRSLHTVVIADDGRRLEVQIRTHEMHQFAEYGIASHWQYKERGSTVSPRATRGDLDHAQQIAWMRQLLAWQRDIGETLGGPAAGRSGEPGEAAGAAAGSGAASSASAASGAPSGHAERIYVLTPQARVVELPAGSTPIDFAYHVHTNLGHRCRGARVDGQLVPLNTVLQNGQTVDIIAAREGTGHDGPSRDWLNPQLGYVHSPRARTKVRQWFTALELERATATGRERVERVLQREGRTALALEEVARRLGFESTTPMFVAIAREEIGIRQLEDAVRGPQPAPARGPSADANGPQGVAATAHDESTIVTRRRRTEGESARGDGVLVVGIDSLMTQLAKCCRPLPPDPIAGFVTKGRGVSIHRESCASFVQLAARAPERVMEATWSESATRDGADGRVHRFPVDVELLVTERPALLRDITEVLARERVNVLAMRTLARQSLTGIRATFEVRDAPHLARTLAAIREIAGVVQARRR